MSHPDWDEQYKAGETPWDTGEPDEHLVEFLRSRSVARGRALDVGCGTGTNALWLARQGFAVLGIDIASAAIETARAKARTATLDCHFATADFLGASRADGPFDLVFDRGCFHVFDKAEDRARFAARVAPLLKRDGKWLSLIGSTEGPERDSGPPRRSARDVIGAIEPQLQIIELRAIQFRALLPAPVAAWWCLSGPRLTPAQPSTQRH
ncbi:MAG TPA: class I SAM-dependent methyltransferase [Steroidobacteraceae bacterium]|nr:class I SAM-dependent methyltransferase [Steroidobacteraceae bacterium]